MEEIKTALRKAEEQYGEGNIFLLSENYCGRYEDDYSYFTYWNNITGETFEDSWTTAAACPAYSNYDGCKRFAKAFEEGLVDKKKYLEYVLREPRELLENLDKRFGGPAAPYFLQTIVSGMPSDIVPAFHIKTIGGRKFKGEGYFVRMIQRQYDEVYVIYDPKSDSLVTASANQCVFCDDGYPNVAGYREFLQRKIDEYDESMLMVKSPVFPIASWAREKFNEEESLIVRIRQLLKEEEEAHKKTEQEFKEKKIKDLIAWAKSKNLPAADSSDAEVQNFAERIFNKKYR